MQRKHSSQVRCRGWEAQHSWQPCCARRVSVGPVLLGCAVLHRAVRMQCWREQFTTGKVLAYSSGRSSDFNVISPQDRSCSSACSHSADGNPPAPSALAAVGNDSEAVMEAQLLVGRAGSVLLSSQYCRGSVSTEPLPSLFFPLNFFPELFGSP